MRFPQVSDRVKEAPAQVLRWVFAGIGQLLLFADKLRSKAPAHQREPAALVPEPAGTALQTAAPRPAAPTAEQAVQPEPGHEVTPERAADTDAADALLPDYDELSVASLRARLRKLDVTQLRQLIGYEQAHAGRAEVIGMYQRRVAKLEAEHRAGQGQAADEAETQARAEVEDRAEAEGEE